MVLAKHDALLSAQSVSGATFINHVETDEEEDLDRLLHRYISLFCIMIFSFAQIFFLYWVKKYTSEYEKEKHVLRIIQIFHPFRSKPTNGKTHVGLLLQDPFV